MRTEVINIKCLVNIREKNKLLRGKELNNLPCIENAYLIIEDGLIAGYGKMDKLPWEEEGKHNVIDASGQMILPAWCDSHTHLVFGSSREQEFIDKINGISYAEIASKGGGILNSANKIAEISELDLLRTAWARLQEIILLGTGAVEIKSGYGLTVESELKILRVIKKLKETSPIPVKATFLGAHTYPLQYKENHQGYIDLIINEMLPVIAKEKLADYIDVFCESGFFSPQETETICKAGISYGLKPKLHVNQLNSIGGIKVGLKLKAVSLDHLETMTDEDIKLLANASSLNHTTIGTLLPTAAYFLQCPFSQQEN